MSSKLENFMIKSVKFQDVWMSHVKIYTVLITLFLMVFAPLSGLLPINLALLFTYIYGISNMLCIHYFLQFRKSVLKNIKDEELKKQAHDLMLKYISQKVK